MCCLLTKLVAELAPDLVRQLLVHLGQQPVYTRPREVYLTLQSHYKDI